MTEEQIKQKAVDFIRKTKGQEYHLVKDYSDERITEVYDTEIKFMIAFATEAIKELQEENEQLKKQYIFLNNQICNKECAEIWSENSEAKEIIAKILKYFPDYEAKTFDDMSLLNALAKAEAFLKECGE